MPRQRVNEFDQLRAIWLVTKLRNVFGMTKYVSKRKRKAARGDDNER